MSLRSSVMMKRSSVFLNAIAAASSLFFCLFFFLEEDDNFSLYQTYCEIDAKCTFATFFCKEALASFYFLKFGFLYSWCIKYLKPQKGGEEWRNWGGIPPPIT